MSQDNELQTFIKDIGGDRNGFYRDHWGGKQTFSELMPVSRADFRRVPLSKRRYKDENALVKIVRDADGPFLSEWGFDDISKESFGTESARPMVYMSNGHEALEKAAWCHARDMTALIGEREAAVAAVAAKVYKPDSLITDPIAFAKLAPHLSVDTRFATLSLLATTFASNAFPEYLSKAKRVRLVMALPEVGAFAESSPDEYPRFRTLPQCIVEEKDGTWLLTKTRLLVTPVIRFCLPMVTGVTVERV